MVESKHKQALEDFLEYVEKHIEFKLNKEDELLLPTPISPPQGSNLEKLVKQYNLSQDDIFFLTFAHCTEFQKGYFDPIFNHFKRSEIRNLYGGELIKNGEFLPSLKTFLGLFHPEERRMERYLQLTHPQHPFNKFGIIEYSSSESVKEGNYINLTPKVVPTFTNFILGGDSPRLDHEPDFPARLLSSKLTFEEVVLSDKTYDDLKPTLRMMEVRNRILGRKDLKKYIRESQIVVFTGSPGTGKSLTATTMGKLFGLPAYGLDFSRVLSRYVGDFEKAMERVFSRLEGRDCVLFIDEADSIFAKRTEEIKDTKDKYANQEMSYLLQRLENFRGIVVLASNVKDIRSHLDKAMLRRISALIEFPFPLEKQRKELWSKNIPKGYTFAPGVLDKLAKSYQLTGANIASIMSNFIFESFYYDTTEITLEILKPIMQSEYYKRDSKFMECDDDAPGAILMEQRMGRSAVHSGQVM
ncbi:ATP-binding protein [Flammeovirga aprica]|uniref:ATP-binding protein n=1 Tax=Flammeovirga aprica JL-4 TaxID=694437 RepID=A0A7X9RZH5_9BACT|nr:ATP-binding protein [Flammeovirga aprica]NME71540.1 ATP-binding protein [Flammeovirga aprica JL-4]